jgi:putative membrane-bound dehydrogenase-like protein
LVVIRSALAALPPRENIPPLEPAAALAAFRTEEGVRIELVAAEPLVVDPVAFVFDAKGRLFVAEGRGYPDAIGGKGRTTLGRIALLEDTDGDGRYDRRTEFATGLGYVNGLQPWRGGLIVTMAPDIIYLKDNDGDGVADERRVLLTGFEDTKTAQLRVSHPTLGLDGLVYVTSGLNGGKVTAPSHPERAAVNFTPRDSRFDPDTLQFENTGGRAQFGLSFDPFGRRFICSNRHPVLQVMLEPWILARNPHLAVADLVQEVSRVESEAKVFPLSGASVSADYIPKLMGAPHSGTFTSACGVLVFGGTALGPAGSGSVFICEPAQNLIQRQALRPLGAAFRAEPATPGREFVASSDVWFRPVFLGGGPDGALYVADMYRREIDHPAYVPEESRGGLDFEGGKDRGRIYRITRASSAGEVREHRPDLSSTAGRIAALASADEWWRAEAFRLLIEGDDPSATPSLMQAAREAQRPETRVRALWALRHAGALTPAVVVAALRDADPGVRENALRLAAEMPAQADLERAVARSADDQDMRVRFAAATALARVEGAVAVEALARIARRDPGDRWVRAAVLAGAGGRMESFFAALAAENKTEGSDLAPLLEQFGRTFGAGGALASVRSHFARAVQGAGDLSSRIALVRGLIDGCRSRTDWKSSKTSPVAFLRGEDGALTEDWGRFAAAAGQHAADARRSTGDRVAAIALLGELPFAESGARLLERLGPREPIELQLAAVKALERTGDVQGARALVTAARWPGYTPQLREAVVAVLITKPEAARELLGAVEAGVIRSAELSSTRRTQLLKHSDATVRTRAEALLRNLEDGDRMGVYRRLRDGLAIAGDVEKGRVLFGQVCAACHTYAGVGGRVGPDLSGLKRQPADALLLHIVVPNYEVLPAYQAVEVALAGGRVATGWVVAETDAAMTLRTPAGIDETVLRAEVTRSSTSGLSLMPDGLEQSMPERGIYDIIAYLKSGR